MNQSHLHYVHFKKPNCADILHGKVIKVAKWYFNVQSSSVCSGGVNNVSITQQTIILWKTRVATSHTLIKIASLFTSVPTLQFHYGKNRQPKKSSLQVTIRTILLFAKDILYKLKQVSEFLHCFGYLWQILSWHIWFQLFVAFVWENRECEIKH